MGLESRFGTPGVPLRAGCADSRYGRCTQAAFTYSLPHLAYSRIGPQPRASEDGEPLIDYAKRYGYNDGREADSHAHTLSNPRLTDSPTLPFTREEMTRILAACNDYAQTKAGSANAARLRAFVLLLRYTGLRIRDVVTLSRDRITDGKLFLYTAKTGTAVYCPLPAAVTQALNAIPTTSARFYFWTGESEPKSAVGDWQRSLRRLFALANVPGGHAHRFRDTFAVELLLAGVPLERVSVLLGHQSTRITEKHYSPWVKARQEQLEADVRRSWAADLVAQSETKGTPEVHGGRGLVN